MKSEAHEFGWAWCTRHENSASFAYAFFKLRRSESNMLAYLIEKRKDVNNEAKMYIEALTLR